MKLYTITELLALHRDQLLDLHEEMSRHLMVLSADAIEPRGARKFGYNPAHSEPTGSVKLARSLDASSAIDIRPSSVDEAEDTFGLSICRA